MCRSKWCDPSTGFPQHVLARFSPWCQIWYAALTSGLAHWIANHRKADFVSAFPAGVNVAATFHKGLAYARGQAMGAEHQGKGVDIQLGPVAGPLGRAPEGGRNWEGFR